MYIYIYIYITVYVCIKKNYIVFKKRMAAQLTLEHKLQKLAVDYFPQPLMA